MVVVISVGFSSHNDDDGRTDGRTDQYKEVGVLLNGQGNLISINVTDAKWTVVVTYCVRPFLLFVVVFFCFDLFTTTTTES